MEGRSTHPKQTNLSWTLSCVWWEWSLCLEDGLFWGPLPVCKSLQRKRLNTKKKEDVLGLDDTWCRLFFNKRRMTVRVSRCCFESHTCEQEKSFSRLEIVREASKNVLASTERTRLKRMQEQSRQTPQSEARFFGEENFSLTKTRSSVRSLFSCTSTSTRFLLYQLSFGSLSLLLSLDSCLETSRDLTVHFDTGLGQCCSSSLSFLFPTASEGCRCCCWFTTDVDDIVLLKRGEGSLSLSSWWEGVSLEWASFLFFFQRWKWMQPEAKAENKASEILAEQNRQTYEHSNY